MVRGQRPPAPEGKGKGPWKGEGSVARANRRRQLQTAIPILLGVMPPPPHRPVPRPTTMKQQKRWANTTAWWIFMNCEKSIDTADCQESINI